MAGVPYIFGNATTSIPLTNLDANFNTGLTIGNTTVGLGNTVTTLGNVILTNSTIASGVSNAVIYTNSSGNYTTNASAFSIVSGNVGIGTATASSTLHVSSSSTDMARFVTTSANGGYIRFLYNTNTINGYIGSAQNLVVGGAAADFAVDVSGANNFVVGTNDNTRLTVTNGGIVALVGSNVSASGVGIAFPSSQSASSDANTLDDYEEGTFTPTYTFTSGSATITAYGYYTKVGNAVTVNCYVGITAIGTASGSATLAGFPFTAKNTSNRTVGFGVNGDNWVGTVGSVSGYITSNTTVGGFYYQGTGSANGFSATNTPTTAYMVFSVTYLI